MIKIYKCKIDKDLTIVCLGKNKKEAFIAAKAIFSIYGPVSMVKLNNIKLRKRGKLC